MKKTLGIVALFTVIVLSLSAHTARVIDAVPGQKAPDFQLQSNNQDAREGEFAIADIDGYVLINFWSTSDANSRVAAGAYDRAVKAIDGINLISLNFDSNSVLFNEVVRHDGLDASHQYNLSGDAAAEIMDLYHLNEGYRSVLIDPRGVIVAVDPDPETLSSIV